MFPFKTPAASHDFPPHFGPRARPLITALKVGSLVSALILVAPLVSAQQIIGTDASPTERLKRMTVEELLTQSVSSVSRKPEPWGEAASNVFLIRGLAAQSIGATTLPDLLRLAPNLFVAQSASGGWAVNARGFVRTNGQSNKLLVMIDGRTVYSPLFSNVFWDATSVFLPDLDHIEVISGPAGSTWGANAVNGVISIQSKSARDTLGGLVNVTTGTQQDTIGVRYGTLLGKEGAMRVYVQHSKTDPTKSTTGASDDMDPWNFTQAGFRADWGNDSDGAFTLQGDWFAGRYDNGSLPQTQNDGANLLARWSRDFSPDSKLWVRAYHDYSKRDTQGLLTEITRTTDLEFQHQLALGPNQELLWGGNYRLISDSVKPLSTFAVLPANLDFGLGSGFVQHELKFADNALALTSGLRMEHNYFSGWEYLPSVRLAWHHPGQTVWIAVSRATRIPSRLDTDIYLPRQAPYLLGGGPNFTAEVLHAYELGWRTQPVKSVVITATLFYHDYDHLRGIASTGQPAPAPVLVIANGVDGQSHGGELFVDWDVTPWWRMRGGGFAIKQSTSVSPGADTENGLGESSFPQYQAQLRNTFRFGPKVTLWTSLRRVAEVPATEDGGGIVPAYTNLDMNLVWRVRPDLELSLTGRNLLDPSHPEIGGLNARRELARSLQAGVRWTF